MKTQRSTSYRGKQPHSQPFNRPTVGVGEPDEDSPRANTFGLLRGSFRGTDST